MKRAKYLSYEKTNEPTEINDILGTLIERASVRIDVRQGDLVTRWREVVPGDWVDAATPIGISDHVLLVEVPSGTAGSLLRYQTEPLLDAIAQVYGADLVTAVRLRVTR